MAIFKKTKKEVAEKPQKEAVKSPVVSAVPSIGGGIDSKSVIVRPRITEKATEKSMNDNVYVFEITKDATKNDVASQIKTLYKVFPTKVAITKIHSKKKFIRGKVGRTAGGKKAYVYLKKGDKIDIA